VEAATKLSKTEAEGHQRSQSIQEAKAARRRSACTATKRMGKLMIGSW